MIEKVFATIEERDSYISRCYPTRRCLGAPGFFKVPGGTLSVFLHTVKLRPNPPKAPKTGGAR